MEENGKRRIPNAHLERTMRKTHVRKQQRKEQSVYGHRFSSLSCSGSVYLDSQYNNSSIFAISQPRQRNTVQLYSYSTVIRSSSRVWSSHRLAMSTLSILASFSRTSFRAFSSSPPVRNLASCIVFRNFLLVRWNASRMPVGPKFSSKAK